MDHRGRRGGRRARYGEWRETWYVPYEQHAGTFAASTVHLMVRSRVEPAAALAAMREAVTSIDPLLPVPEPQS